MIVMVIAVRVSPLWTMLTDYLDVGAEPHTADYIIVLDGHEDRLQRAAELFHNGYAPYILTGITSLERNEEHRQTLLRLGVPDDVIIPNCCGTSTWEEAQAHIQLLQERGAETALVVTHWQHTRRSRAIFEKLLADRPLEVTMISAPYTEGTLASDDFVVSEYGKMLYYLLRYRVNSWS